MEELRAIEVEVVEFMEGLRLSRLQSPSLSLSGWGSKRKRSAIERSPSPTKTTVNSPATTLSFPPSESEDKQQLSNPITKTKTSKLPNLPNLKKIDNLHKLCDSLTGQNQALLQEIAKVRSYYDKLKEEQFHLKERLGVEREKQEVCLELEAPVSAAALSTSNQEPYIVHHQAIKSGLFDLNVVPAEETADLRWLRMAAQARLNRKMRKEKIQQRNNGCRVTKFRVVNLR